MMYRLSALLLAISAGYFFTYTEGINETTCKQKNNISDTIVCKSAPMSEICLVCPITRHKTGALWKRHDNEIIFIGDVRLTDLSVNVSVNNCSSENYSLSLHATDFTVEGIYTCYENEDLMLSRFLVRIQVSPVITLTCVHPIDRCGLTIYKDLALSFRCDLLHARRPFQLIWMVDEHLKFTENFAEPSESSAIILNESSYFNYSFTGNEVNITCQIDGQYVVQSDDYLNFQPDKKVNPFLTVSFDGRENVTFFEFSKNFTVQVVCMVTSVKLPVTLSWEVDGQERFSERFENIRGKNLQIKLAFTPIKERQNITCVCKGIQINEGRHTITVLFYQSSFDHIIHIIAIGVAAVLVLFLLSVFVMKTKSCLTESRLCNTNTVGEYTVGMAMGFHQEGDIYCMPDACEQLSRCISLRNQLSGGGRFNRWFGELSGVSYHRKTCVATTYADSASEGEKEEFRRLVVYMKDAVNHDYVVQVLGIEIQEGPTFIYTEYVENGDLQSFLINQTLARAVSTCTEIDLLKFCHDITSALVYLKSLELAHPVIHCRKVLLTKWNTCKVYDMQLYPVSRDIISQIVSKRNKSLSFWVAPETQERREHTYLSDSWSLAVFIWEVYSWGMDPTYSGISCNVQYNTKLLKPEKCPNYIYSILLSCWEVNVKKRPTLEKIQNNLVDIVGQSNSNNVPSLCGGGKSNVYQNV